MMRVQPEATLSCCRHAAAAEVVVVDADAVVEPRLGTDAGAPVCTCLDVDVVERVGTQLVLRIDLHDHEVLVEAGIHGGDLALTEGIVEDLIDGGGGDAEARCGVAIDDEGFGQSLILLIGGDVAQFRHGAHRAIEPRRPGVQLAEIFVGQRVLILRSAAAAADLNVLLRLEEKRGAGNAGEFSAQPFTTSSAETWPGWM